MKTLKQLREEYNADFLGQVDYLPDEIVLDEAKGSPSVKKLQTLPSPSQMPVVLVFRRITYRTYPDKQTVALYYSKMVDKYLSIPFGPTGNLNLSEAQVVEGKMLDAIKGGAKGAVTGALKGAAVGNVAHLPGMTAGAAIGGAVGAYRGAKKALQKEEDELDEDWQKVNRRDKTDGLSQAAVNAYRRENPGSKLQTAVTEKNPKGKRAARRKSFCSRMGGMKKRLTSAKTARDPDSRINKALRRWNCEEDFQMKLYELRMQQNEGIADYLDAGAEAIVPYYSAGKKLYKGDYKGAATDAAIDTGLLATGAIAGKAIGAGVRGISKLASKIRAPKQKSWADAMKTSSKKVEPKTPKTSGGSNLPGMAGAASDAAKDAARAADPGTGIQAVKSVTVKPSQAKAKTYSGWQKVSQNPIAAARERKVLAQQSGTIKENKISDIRNMISEGVESMNLPINGRSITLNTSMAKRILEVYDSVNTKNKKIVEGMLNEDLESFKKLLNFSIKA